MARKNQVVGFVQNEDGSQVYSVGGESVVFHPDMVHADCRVRAELHGWKQRISDKAALGKDATGEEKLAAIRAVVGHFESGTADWAMVRGTGKGRKSEVDWTCEALADIQGTDVASAVGRLEEMAEKHGTTKEALAKKLRTKREVALRVAELQVKDGRLADGGEVDAALDALLEGGMA